MNQTQLTFQDIQTAFHPLFNDLAPHIVDSFFSYHTENPQIFELFKHFAKEARQRWAHFGAKAIIERMRWETNLNTHDGQFKLNNNFPACYARLLISEDPSFKDFFEIRHTPGTVEIF